VNTKAQGILNGAKWVEETYGRDALCEVLRGCSPAVRECLASAIAINWHPLDELVEFVTAADRLLGRGDGKVAEEIGAAGARANLKGVIARMAFLLATPDYLMRRVAALYLQFNDQGEMLLTSLSPGVGEIELRGRPKVYPIHCSIITGWARAASVALGARRLLTR